MAEVSDYKVIACVFGSRSYNDYNEFCGWLRDYVSWLASDSLCFISGAANAGADAMIIRWAKENGYECFEYPADWDLYGKGAGYMRNRKMRGIATHALGFWDGVSPGTFEMIEGSMEDGLILSTIIVRPDEVKFGNKVFHRKKYHEHKRKAKQKGSGSFHSGGFRRNPSWQR